MTAFLAPDPIQSTQFIPGGNTPAAGGLLFCYNVGSTTKQNTYTDPTASTARTNPIVLDSGGNIPGNGEVWITSSAKFVLAPSNDTDPPASPYWSRDNLPGVNDPSQVQSEWIASGLTPTFVNSSTFVLNGDQTSTFTQQRRIKTQNTGGFRFGTVTSSAFSASTTIGVASDSIGMDAGLSAVSYGIINTYQDSQPNIVSITRFGATGGTDDSAAIQAAFSSGIRVFVPPGTFNCSASINLPTNLQIYGSGRRQSLLNFTGSSDGLVCSFGSQTASNLMIRDLGLVGSSTVPNLLRLNNASLVSLENLWLRLAGTNSIISDGSCIETSVKNCHFSEAGKAFWNVNSGLTAILEFNGCQFDTDTTPPIPVSSDSAAIYVGSSGSLTFPTFINTNQNGGQANGMGSFVRVYGGMSFAQLINAYVEQTALACILASSSGIINLMGIKGGHLHCITATNSATIDLNNGVSHFGISIEQLRQTSASSVAVFNPGISSSFSYKYGSKDLGNQHVVGFNAGLDNIEFNTSSFYEKTGRVADFNVLSLKHTHSSTPRGMIVSFTGGAPNNSTQAFFHALDTAADRYKVLANGTVQAALGSGFPTGGTAGLGYQLSSTNNFGTFYGSSAPTLIAGKGSMYLRNDGSNTSNRAYVNTDGISTWTAIITLA